MVEVAFHFACLTKSAGDMRQMHKLGILEGTARGILQAVLVMPWSECGNDLMLWGLSPFFCPQIGMCLEM